MARQNQTAYEELRQKYYFYNQYKTASQAVPQGKHVQNLSQLASLVASKQGEDELSQRLLKSNNLFELFPFIKSGLEDSKKDFENFGKENLEKIIDSSPADVLKENLLYIKPEGSGKYKGIAELHKEVAEMQMNLGAYLDREGKVPQELKAKAFEKIQQRALKYFMGKYMNNQAFLGALINYIQASPDGEQILLAKYNKLASEKTEDFSKKIDKIAIPYTKAVLSKKDAPVFYEIVLRQADSEQQAQRKAA